MSAVVPAPPRRRRRPKVEGAPASAPPTPPETPPLPYLLDFYPLEAPSQTRLSAFFDALKEGRFTTTRCRRDGKLLWPPRAVCPICHTTDLDWVDLPRRGRVHAFSALLAGAPLGQEPELPIVVGLVDLDGAPLRLFGRLLGADWRTLPIGAPVEVEPLRLPDGRSYYAFRVAPG